MFMSNDVCFAHEHVFEFLQGDSVTTFLASDELRRLAIEVAQMEEAIESASMSDVALRGVVTNDDPTNGHAGVGDVEDGGRASRTTGERASSRAASV